MRKKTFKRLHLRRETLQSLEPRNLGALLLVKGVGSDQSDPCCHTTPPLILSGACAPRTDECTCSTGPA